MNTEFYIRCADNIAFNYFWIPRVKCKTWTYRDPFYCCAVDRWRVFWQ